jgi:hypothetical protein
MRPLQLLLPPPPATTSTANAQREPTRQRPDPDAERNERHTPSPDRATAAAAAGTRQCRESAAQAGTSAAQPQCDSGEASIPSSPAGTGTTSASATADVHRCAVAITPHRRRTAAAPPPHRAVQCHGLLSIFCDGYRLVGTQYVFYVFPRRFFGEASFFWKPSFFTMKKAHGTQGECPEQPLNHGEHWRHQVLAIFTP